MTHAKNKKFLINSNFLQNVIQLNTFQTNSQFLLSGMYNPKEMPPKKKRSTRRTADCCVPDCDECAKYVPRSFTDRVPTHCEQHAQPRDDYFEYSERLCEVQTCTKRASFALDRDHDAVRCGTHKLASDINTAKKLCECGKSKPFFGPPDTRSAKRCGLCKQDGDVDLYNKKCIRCKEKQVAAIVQGQEDEGMKYCLSCATTLGFSCRNGRVAYCECGTQSTFDIPGTAVKSARFCGQCRDPSLHVDVRHENYMCTVCCNTRGTRVHNGSLWCHGCFVKTFPEIPTLRNYKTKQRAVEDFLNTRFSDKLTLRFDRQLERILPEGTVGAGAGTCDGGDLEEDVVCKSSGRKPDVMIDMGEWVVIVEVDEGQHKQDSYKSSCETKRVMQIFDDVGRRPTVFIRFNPDHYEDAEGNKVHSPWTIDGRTGSALHVAVENRDKWNDRLNTLASAVECAISTRPEREVSFTYLYYDGCS